MNLRWPLALVALVTGSFLACAYYNGLYNANRLVRDAEKAEREGRIGEARSLWSQAAVKAESVSTRYPDSRYRDDALLLQGRALQAAGECANARAPLEDAVESSPDPTLRDTAALLLGQCYVVLSEYRSAVEVLSPLVTGRDTSLSRSASLWRGKALLATSDYAAALIDLQAAERFDAAFDLSIAYALSGKPGSARASLATRLQSRYSESRWLEVLDTIGNWYPDDAAALVAVLEVREDLTRGQRARLFLADGRRWAGSGEWRSAADSYERAVQAAGDSVDGRVAAVQLVLMRARSAQDPSELPELADAMERAVSALDNGAEQEADRAEILRGAAHTLEIIEGAAGNSLDLRARHADLDLFLYAEGLRDEIKAPGIAAGLLRHLAERIPSSPIAPKALIAAAQMDPERSDSLLLVLHVKYATSPYTLQLRGVAGDQYTAIEDSLRSLIAVRRKTTPREK